MPDVSRYRRQMVLPEIGSAGQARLAQARVLVVGAGGLGCPVLQYLAGAGVGRIMVTDPDVVEESNLHRQPLYRMADIGRAKADAAAAHLSAANPDVRIVPQVCALDPSTAPDAVAEADLVVDAADSFAVSYILSDACQDLGRPLVSASALAQSGYAGGFCGGAPSLRAVFPDLPATAATCATAGVMGPAVGMIGALQAQMALKVLLGHDPSPLGQLMTFDLGALSAGGFRFDGAEEPAGGLKFVAASDVVAGDVAVELRPAGEAPKPALPQALRILPEDIGTAGLPKGQRIILCCRSGLRAWKAGRTLQEAGYRDLALLAAGDTA